MKIKSGRPTVRYTKLQNKFSLFSKMNDYHNLADTGMVKIWASWLQTDRKATNLPDISFDIT